MNYAEEIAERRADPAGLERLYRDAQRAGQADAFVAALEAAYAAAPDDRLLSAWHHRLAPDEAGAALAAGHAPWPLAIVLSLACAILFGLLIQPDKPVGFGDGNLIMWIWAPLSAAFVLAFLTLAGRLPLRRVIPVILGLAGLTAYAYLLGNQFGRSIYAELMFIHLPLLAWIAVGLGLVGFRSNADERFAFLVKSVEVFVAGGLFLIVGGVLVAVTAGLFQTLGVDLFRLDVFVRLWGGGAGLIPVLAVATIYDPRLSPLEQRFEEGLSRLLAAIFRLALPLTLLVLVIYIGFIPFNFMQPFRNREVLIVYNVLLFAVMGLLIGASPAKLAPAGLRGEKWLRAGLSALAGLTLLVSLYAMSATVYRTIQGGLTINRVTIIGWNTINIGILVLLLYWQIRRGAAGWVAALHRAFSVGTIGYTVWTVFLVVAMPWLFPPM